MSKKGIFNSKFINEYYIKQSENEIKKLDEKNSEYKKKIEEEELKLKNSMEELDKLKSENKNIKIQYEELINIIKSRGITFDLKKGNLEINEWDNLYINKINGKIALVNKKDDSFEPFDENINILLKEILKITDSYSIVVVRIIGNKVKVQLRI